MKLVLGLHSITRHEVGGFLRVIDGAHYVADFKSGNLTLIDKKTIIPVVIPKENII